MRGNVLSPQEEEQEVACSWSPVSGQGLDRLGHHQVNAGLDFIRTVKRSHWRALKRTRDLTYILQVAFRLLYEDPRELRQIEIISEITAIVQVRGAWSKALVGENIEKR